MINCLNHKQYIAYGVWKLLLKEMNERCMRNEDNYFTHATGHSTERMTILVS